MRLQCRLCSWLSLYSLHFINFFGADSGLRGRLMSFPFSLQIAIFYIISTYAYATSYASYTSLWHYMAACDRWVGFAAAGPDFGSWRSIYYHTFLTFSLRCRQRSTRIDLYCSFFVTDSDNFIISAYSYSTCFHLVASWSIYIPYCSISISNLSLSLSRHFLLSFINPYTGLNPGKENYSYSIPYSRSHN